MLLMGNCWFARLNENLYCAQWGSNLWTFGMLIFRNGAPPGISWFQAMFCQHCRLQPNPSWGFVQKQGTQNSYLHSENHEKDGRIRAPLQRSHAKPPFQSISQQISIIQISSHRQESLDHGQQFITLGPHAAPHDHPIVFPISSDSLRIFWRVSHHENRS